MTISWLPEWVGVPFTRHWDIPNSQQFNTCLDNATDENSRNTCYATYADPYFKILINWDEYSLSTLGHRGFESWETIALKVKSSSSNSTKLTMYLNDIRVKDEWKYEVTTKSASTWWWGGGWWGWGGWGWWGWWGWWWGGGWTTTKTDTAKADTGAVAGTWTTATTTKTDTNSEEKTDSNKDTNQNNGNNNSDKSWYEEWNQSETLTNWYSREFNNAYRFAFRNKITTMNDISKADMNWPLNRIAMAKMLSNYAINILGKKPDTTKKCSFPDVNEKLNSDYNDGVTLACQLGIMWVGIEKFRPYDPVNRGEFGTSLSRMLFGLADGTDNYYSTHLKELKKRWIISNDNPNLEELRWYVMLMLMRSAM